ncbi:MAG: hypothetical protein JST50_20195 [Bacteroidetes bacterium]|jgi:hypothetical protein|nr:hypothetical protein [Bacteroidota bacterium]
MKRAIFILAALLTNVVSFSQTIDLQKMLAGGNLMYGPSSQVKPFDEGDKNGITCRDNVWLKDVDFSYGTIELDIRGRNEFLKSFPGIAFYAVDTSRNYDVIYFRPFNFKHSDPVRRTWSVQYMSLPQYGYDRLRKENTGQFESEIIPNPKPEDWIHARIVVAKDSIKVYVNNMDKPSLSVRTLQGRSKGMFGLWTDGTAAEFANLTITNDK